MSEKFSVEELNELIESELPSVPVRRIRGLQTPDNPISVFEPSTRGFWVGNDYYFDDSAEVHSFKIKLNGTKITVTIKEAYSKEEEDNRVAFVDASVSREHTKTYMFDDLRYDKAKLKSFCKEIEHLSVNKDDLFKNLPYNDIAKKLKMEKIKTKDPTGTFTALYSKDKMAYGDAFPYNDLFTYTSDNTSLVKKLCKKYNLNVDIKKIWVCNLDKNLLLINTPGFHFLTTVDNLTNDIKAKVK